MSYNCQVKDVAPQPILSIRGKTTPSAIPMTIGEFLKEVLGYVQSKGGQLAGPPFTRYHKMAEDEVDMEAGFPVASPLPGEGRIEASELPSGPVASTYHIGPYDTLNTAEAAIDNWVSTNGQEAAGPSWHIYWTDPGEVPNPQEWKTEVVRPLKAS
ncbi:MAG TPA: GyrI-like domain-containing protein [Blastocatellia bacterium]|jgi:effector-binding domain-containing protein